MIIRQKSRSRYTAEEILEVSNYLLQNKKSIRETAKYFSLSRTSIHRIISVNLKSVDEDLYDKVKLLMESNKSTWQSKGGIAKSIKYKNLTDSIKDN